MCSNLVIVESKTKSGVISKYLNRSDHLKHHGHFDVIACFGHIRDLHRKQFSVDTTTFECMYEELPGKKQIIKQLRNKISQATMVYLASDNDREGEAIAWHLRELFRIPKSKYKRILFNEITANALEKAVMNPTDIDLSMVNAQQCRRILDRIVGYKTTGILWKHFGTSNNTNTNPTAGRVQSAILNLIVQKETEINEFKSTQSWTICGDFGKMVSNTTLHYKKNVHIINTVEESLNFLEGLKSLSKPKVTIESFVVSDSFDNPPAPFITSTLQQAAYRSLKFPLVKTMKVAQSLYEKGLITYMRTDSATISKEFVQKIKQHLLREPSFGTAYTNFDKCDRGETYFKNRCNAQEAHEAIRPTNLIPEPKCTDSSSSLTHDEIKLYGLIFKRTLAFYMKSAHYKCLTIGIRCENLPSDDYVFIGKERLLYFDGWLKLYQQKTPNPPIEEVIDQFTQLSQGNSPHPLTFKKCMMKCSWTSPPSRFNESTLVQKLEVVGIGRPSTYATMISKLQDKHCVETRKINGTPQECVSFILSIPKKTIDTKITSIEVGSESGRISPTAMGLQLNNFMVTNFQSIVDEKFTSSMEAELDLIAVRDGHNYKEYLKSFYNTFQGMCFQVTPCASSPIADDNKSRNAPSTEIKPDEVAGTIYEHEKINAILATKYSGNCTVCKTKQAKFGPVIEIDGMDLKGKSKKDKSKVYIDLKPYCEITKRPWDALTVDEIVLLISVPVSFEIDTSSYALCYGRYGFYMRKNNGAQTQKIDTKWYPKILEGDFKTILDAIALH